MARLSLPRLDVYLLLVWLLTIPAALPLWQPTPTASADGLLHLYRLVALQQAVAQGALFPRWLPDLAFGYGFPLFVFYAPLAYYLTLALAYLPGLTLLTAFNLSLMLALFVAASGAYLFVKELLGQPAGLLAAMAYAYAPFQLYNAFFRGGLPAAWALALFPLAFWLFTRLLATDRLVAPATPLAALALGLALLTHNTLSLLFVPLLLLYLATALLLTYFSRQPIRPLAARLLLALALGGGLAAFFLLPAIIEQDFAQVERVIISPDFDFRYHFVTLTQLLSLPPAANTGLLNPTVPLTLGLPQAGLALIGLLAGAFAVSRSRHPDHAPAIWLALLFGAAALAGAITMMLRWSQPLWERLPLIAFVQFPHRLLGPATLVLALLAGLAVFSLNRRAAFWLTAAGIGLIFLASGPLLYPRYRDTLLASPSLTDMFAYERASGAIGTTSFGEYLPRWVAQIPRESPLESQYQAGQPAIDRLAADYLPPNTAVTARNLGFNQAGYTLDAPAPYQAVFNSFYFPGWQAEINGQPARLTPFSERGLIAVDMPAGSQRLTLFFTDTPIRRAANLVSGLALLLTLTLLAVALRSRSAAAAAPRRAFSRRQVGLLLTLAIGLIGLKLLYLDRFDSPIRRVFSGGPLPGVDTPLTVNFGNQINLLGYDLPAAERKPGETFNVTLYWQARAPLVANYSALAHLIDADGHLYAGQDNLHPGTIRTDRWQPWTFVQDPHAVPVPPGTPPGNYLLAAGLYNPTTLARLPVIDGAEPAWPDVVTIPVAVAPAEAPASLSELAIAWPQSVNIGPALRLLGATPERDALQPNDFLRIALFWEARQAPAQNYTVNLQLVNPTTAEAIAATLTEPSHGRYPTTRWAAGERVRDNHALWIPASTPPGRYQLQVRLLDTAGAPLSTWLTLGSLPLP